MTPKARVLVVDDERLTRETTVRQLKDAGYGADAAENAYRALERVEDGAFEVVVTDLRMPGMDGLELLRTLRRRQPEVDVVLMTAYATVQTAVAAMQEGAADYLTKPFHFEELAHRLERIGELRGYRREVRDLRAQLSDDRALRGFLGASPPMRRVASLIRTFAAHTAPVLITGETGTGKERVARLLHEDGPRSGAPWIPVACGAIPGDLAESELFGHERGAFTGASRQRIGAFERAHGGTLLLDDVDDLPLAIQAKLLRALQEGTFQRVGGSRECHVDVRVVATSKVDLAVAAEEHHFREDLYYRLRGLEIQLPPLRERGDDVLLLAQHFARRFASSAGRDEPSLSPDVVAVLRGYPWPGNVRELYHAMESALALCPRGDVLPEHLPDRVRSFRPKDASVSGYVTLHLDGHATIPFADVVRDVEDALVQWAMVRASGQQTRAADLLGLARTTLQSKLRSPAKP